MIKFKAFLNALKRELPPILVDAYPTHGSHANPKKKKLKEEAHPFPAMKNMDTNEWITHNPNPHIGHSPEDADNTLSMDKEKWYKHPDSWHVYSYSGKSNHINNYLVDKAHGRHTDFDAHKDDLEHTKEFKKGNKKDLHEQIRGIDNAISKYKHKKDLHVFHGSHNFNPDEYASKHPERKIKIPSFLSTSIDPYTAHTYANYNPKHDENEPGHILHIHVKKGQKGLYIGKRSNYSEEKEFLLPRNTTLQVHHKPTILPDGNHIWHAHITDQTHEDLKD